MKIVIEMDPQMWSLIREGQIPVRAYESIVKGKPLRSVFDKIRAEMAEEILSHSGTGEEVIQAYVDGLKKGLKIIDKYKESEETK